MPTVVHGDFEWDADEADRIAHSVGEIVAIDSDLWPHFGSQRAVNEALRRLVEGSGRS